MRLTLVHSALPERKRRWGHPALSRPSVSDKKLLAATYTPNQLRLHYSQVRGLVKPLRRRNSFRIVPAKPEAAGWLAVCHRRTTRMVARQPASPLATGGFRYKKLEPTFGFEPKTCCLRNRSIASASVHDVHLRYEFVRRQPPSNAESCRLGCQLGCQLLHRRRP